MAKGKKAMSEELTLPDGVTAVVTGRVVTLKGPKGETSREITSPNARVEVRGGTVAITTEKASKMEKKVVGSLRAHIVNMMNGVTVGHLYKLKVCYTHFPITVVVSGRKLQIKNIMGEKTPREIELPDGVKVKVEGADIMVESTDKEAASQAAASIEELGKRANFDTRVFNDGVYITMKDGREIK